MESCPSTPQHSLSNELRALINQRNMLSADSKAKVLHALDVQIEENKKRRRVDLRSKVIEEIYTSEISYLHQLELVMKYFKEPLESSELMSSTMQRSLFGNIESIYQVNGELVHQLSVQRNNVGAAFVRLAPFFKLYSMYAYDYKAVLNLLEDIPRDNSRLSVWLKNQETRPEVNSSLSALLIAPIQRLPRYRLLLRQLLSLTPVAHPHYSTLVDAVKEVEKATSHIECLVSEHEVHARLVTLQRCLVNCKPSIVAPNSRLLKEGTLMKMSANGKRAQRRYFILLSDSLLYCKLVGRERDRPPSEPGSLQCCCVLPISKCSIEPVLGQGVLNLKCRSETYILFSEHRDHAMEWVAQIKAAAAQYKDNLKTLRNRRSSSRHPLHLNRKRKVQTEIETDGENIPNKRAKALHENYQEQENMQEDMKKQLGTAHRFQEDVHWPHFVQPIKSLFQTFGESVRRYLYPGPTSR